MQITCSKCGTGITLPAETQSGDLIRCGACGRKIRINVRPARSRAADPANSRPREARSRRGGWVLTGVALLVICVVSAAIWMNGPPNLGVLRENVERQIARTGLISDEALRDESRGDGESSLAAQVAALFEQRCHRCHGAGGSDEGGFNYVVRLDKLTEEDVYVTAGSPSDSYLFSRIEEGEMPPADSGEALSDEEIALVREWIEAGAPPVGSEPAAIELISSDDLLRIMRDDLLALDEGVRRDTRYFTLTHLYNAGLSQDELETYRLAMAKLLNSLSWERELVTPERVGAGETLLRINLRDLGWDSAKWDAIVDTDPYAVTVESDDGRAIRDLTGADVLHVRADWFVSRASRAPLYYELLEIPETLDELARRVEIGVDIGKNIADDRVIRAAFVESGVSDNNRMIERHRTPFGAFWVSYDFASSVDRQNVLEHPLGPEGEDAFDHDGGEIIFNLPNGLQGYMLVDGEGERIEKGPINIVADDKLPDRQVVAGLSCMSCHANGMIRKQDEVRPTVLANRSAYAQADRILRQYPEAATLEEVFAEDTDRFESSLKQLGFERLTETSEPIYHMAKRFDQAVEGSLAAAEFGLVKEKFFELLDRSPAVAKVLGVLKTPGGKVKRQQFLAVFKEAAEAFGLGIGRGPDATPAATLVANNAAPSRATVTTNAANPPVVATNPAAAADTPATPIAPETTATPTAAASPPNPQLAGVPGAPATAEGRPATSTVPLLSPESLLRNWTRGDGQPLLYARFLGVTAGGDVRVALVPRQWTLESGDSESEYPAFSGTFWAFYQRPGTPVLVRIGDVRLPDVPLNYVDYAREAFCEEDRAYLAHLEKLIDYAYVNKGRVRYYTLPWDLLSLDDQQFVYSVIAALQATKPPTAGTPTPQPPTAGSPPPAAEVPAEEPAGPPDLPATEAAPEPGADAPTQRPPYGY